MERTEVKPKSIKCVDIKEKESLYPHPRRQLAIVIFIKRNIYLFLLVIVSDTFGYLPDAYDKQTHRSDAPATIKLLK